MPKQIREIRVNGNIAYVPLTKGYEAVIDAENVPLVAGFNWTAMLSKGTVYAYRKHMKINIFLHRVIAGDPVGMEVDHISGNTMDNRMVNLRPATRLQNGKNLTKHRAGKAKYKGVSWGKSNSKWQAQIYSDGVKRHLGYFRCQTVAALAYIKASTEMHGEFGRPK